MELAESGRVQLGEWIEAERSRCVLNESRHVARSARSSVSWPRDLVRPLAPPRARRRPRRQLDCQPPSDAKFEPRVATRAWKIDRACTIRPPRRRRRVDRRGASPPEGPRGQSLAGHRLSLRRRQRPATWPTAKCSPRFAGASNWPAPTPATRDYNEQGIGICLIGNFDQQPPTRAASGRRAAAGEALGRRYRDRPRRTCCGTRTCRPRCVPGSCFPGSRSRPALPAAERSGFDELAARATAASSWFRHFITPGKTLRT